MQRAFPSTEIKIYISASKKRTGRRSTRRQATFATIAGARFSASTSGAKLAATSWIRSRELAAREFHEIRAGRSVIGRSREREIAREFGRSVERGRERERDVGRGDVRSETAARNRIPSLWALVTSQNSLANNSRRPRCHPSRVPCIRKYVDTYVKGSSAHRGGAGGDEKTHHCLALLSSLPPPSSLSLASIRCNCIDEGVCGNLQSLIFARLYTCPGGPGGDPKLLGDSRLKRRDVSTSGFHCRFTFPIADAR